MIYDKGQLEKLPPVQRTVRKTRKERSLGQKLLMSMYILLLVILLPYIVLKVLIALAWCLGKAFVGLEKAIEMREKSREEQEREGGFQYSLAAASNTYDHESDTLYNRMNYHGLKALCANIRRTYEQKGEPARQSRLNRYLLGRAVPVNETGFHIHSEFFMPQLEHEITIGTLDKDLLRLYDGTTIYGSPQIWREICDQWEKVAEQGEAKLIVLDGYQANWCDAESVGRFVIEYDPEYTVPQEEES